MSGLFFTGTDTGVGKTFVMAAVTRAVRQRGVSVQVSKPVATGSSTVSADCLCLLDAAGLPRGQGHEDRITPWLFAAEAAPPVAARAEGREFRLADALQAVRRQDTPGSLLLVEGVGGLLCPLTESETVADLAVALGLPLIIVARRSLGTLNHTLLTVEAAVRRGLTIAGIVVSETAPVQGCAEETNVEELRRRIAVPLLAVVPHSADIEAAVRAVAHVNWEQLATQ